MSKSKSGPTAPILVEIVDGVARMTLNNPSQKNAISLEMAEMIRGFCDRVDSDTSIGAVIIDATGGYFCSGAYIRDLAASSASPTSSESMSRTSAVYAAFVGIGSLPVPTVSVVAGGAVGAGLNLVMATDIAVVTPDAVLDSGFVARHIHPGGGHLSLLGRSLNRQQSIALGVLGAAVSGDEAVRLGLAWKACPESDLLDYARDLVKLAAADPVLARKVKTSAALELGPGAVTWAAALEVERGVQMWSLSRKGEAGWGDKLAKPSVGQQS